MSEYISPEEKLKNGIYKLEKKIEKQEKLIKQAEEIIKKMKLKQAENFALISEYQNDY